MTDTIFNSVNKIIIPQDGNILSEESKKQILDNLQSVTKKDIEKISQEITEREASSTFQEGNEELILDIAEMFDDLDEYLYPILN